MAFPLTQGSNPESGTLTKDGWRLVAQAVNTAKVNNDFGADQIVYVTYVNTGDAAPVGLNVPKWKIPSDFVQFDDGITARDIYVYPVDADAAVTVEA